MQSDFIGILKYSCIYAFLVKLFLSSFSYGITVIYLHRRDSVYDRSPPEGPVC